MGYDRGDFYSYQSRSLAFPIPQGWNKCWGVRDGAMEGESRAIVFVVRHMMEEHVAWFEVEARA